MARSTFGTLHGPTFLRDLSFTAAMFDLQPDRSRTMDSQSQSQKIFALERPDPALWELYIIHALLTGPGILFMLPYLYFRYHTLRYRFDEEGIHMRVGILFRREVNLTYARIQDIHLSSGFIQRWFGLADIQIQTASGSAGAELVIEGFKEFEAIRDFLYTRMRGYQRKPADAAAGATETAQRLPTEQSAAEEEDAVALLLNIRDELRRTRELLEQRSARSGSSPS
jgi:putative membrane protein